MSRCLLRHPATITAPPQPIVELEPTRPTSFGLARKSRVQRHLCDFHHKPVVAVMAGDLVTAEFCPRGTSPADTLLLKLPGQASALAADLQVPDVDGQLLKRRADKSVSRRIAGQLALQSRPNYQISPGRR